MRSITSLAAILLGVVLVEPVWAVDMCFQVSTKATLVVKGYRAPAAGKCRTWAAYEASTSIPYPATATACLNAARSQMYVHWTWHKEGGLLSSAKQYSAKTTVPYPPPSDGNTAMIESDGNTGTNTSEPTSAYPCNPAPLP